MKKRNPITVFLLSVITFGIYDLYWLVSTKKVLNEKTRSHTPTIWLLVIPVPMIIAGYILLFINAPSTTTTTNGFQNSFSNSSNINTSAHPGLVFLAIALIIVGFLASFLASAYWFYKYSKAVDEYTRGKMSTGVSFLILWLIHLIGVALIQDAFNDMEASGAAVGQNSPPNNTPNSFAPYASQVDESHNIETAPSEETHAYHNGHSHTNTSGDHENQQHDNNHKPS